MFIFNVAGIPRQHYIITMSYLVQSREVHRSLIIFFSTSPWISLCTVSVCSHAQYLQTLLGRHPKPNSFLCSGQIVRSSSHSSNNPTWAKHSLPSSSTPSRGGLKTTIQVLFCATCTILHNKNRSSALVSSRKSTFFLRIFLEGTNTFKIAHLYEIESVGNVGVWWVSSSPLSALPK